MCVSMPFGCCRCFPEARIHIPNFSPIDFGLGHRFLNYFVKVGQSQQVKNEEIRGVQNSLGWVHGYWTHYGQGRAANHNDPRVSVFFKLTSASNSLAMAACLSAVNVWPLTSKQREAEVILKNTLTGQCSFSLIADVPWLRCDWCMWTQPYRDQSEGYFFQDTSFTEIYLKLTIGWKSEGRIG